MNARTLLAHAFGIPAVERAPAYVAGALALVAFRGLTTDAALEESPSSLVASTVHVVATAGTLVVVRPFLDLVGVGRTLVAFFTACAYNLLLLVEEGAVGSAR